MNYRTNKYQKYCTKCHFTVYPSEQTSTTKGLQHINCKDMMSDKSIKRRLNPRVSSMIGNVNKKKLMNLWEEYPNV
jgi:glutathionylspermidine synthase